MGAEKCVHFNRVILIISPIVRYIAGKKKKVCRYRSDGLDTNSSTTIWPFRLGNTPSTIRPNSSHPPTTHQAYLSIPIHPHMYTTGPNQIITVNIRPELTNWNSLVNNSWFRCELWSTLIYSLGWFGSSADIHGTQNIQRSSKWHSLLTTRAPTQTHCWNWSRQLLEQIAVNISTRIINKWSCWILREFEIVKVFNYVFPLGKLNPPPSLSSEQNDDTTTSALHSTITHIGYYNNYWLGYINRHLTWNNPS